MFELAVAARVKHRSLQHLNSDDCRENKTKITRTVLLLYSIPRPTTVKHSYKQLSQVSALGDYLIFRSYV